MIPTVEWKNNRVVILDQRALPEEVLFLDCEAYQEVADAIRNLSVRGAPAIGVDAADCLQHAPVRPHEDQVGAAAHGFNDQGGWPIFGMVEIKAEHTFGRVRLDNVCDRAAAHIFAQQQQQGRLLFCAAPQLVAGEMDAACRWLR